MAVAEVRGAMSGYRGMGRLRARVGEGHVKAGVGKDRDPGEILPVLLFGSLPVDRVTNVHRSMSKDITAISKTIESGAVTSQGKF